MAKRSGTSKGTKSAKKKSEYYGNSATSGHVHEDEYGNTASSGKTVAWIKELAPELTDEEAKKTATTLGSWSGSAYDDIREAQRAFENGFIGSDDFNFQRGEILERYIKAAPKYEGQIFRGIRLDTDAEAQAMINTLANGGSISMGGTASWSSKFSVAEDFSTESPRGIIFVLNGNTKAGTTIQHASHFGKDEAEVLVSRHVKYTATKIVQADNGSGQTIIYVDEHLVG